MTLTVELVLVAAILGLCLGFLSGRLTAPGNKSKKKGQSFPIAIQTPESLPADLEERIRALINDGHKIGALKELRDSTELGLEEAKHIIDSMATSIRTDNQTHTLGTVRNLIRNGKKAEALKLYRESSGMSLKEAKEAIDKMEKEFG